MYCTLWLQLIRVALVVSFRITLMVDKSSISRITSYHEAIINYIATRTDLQLLLHNQKRIDFRQGSDQSQSKTLFVVVPSQLATSLVKDLETLS